MKSVSLAILLLLVASSNSINVLFIGNSFTYYNDMPTIVQNLAAQDGEEMTFVQRTEGGWHWYDHWNSEETLEAIRSQVYDVVIMQEFSRGLAQSDEVICETSYPYAYNLVNEVRTYSPNAMIQFYQTWGYESASPSSCVGYNNPYMCTYDVMQDRITEGYDDVACQLADSRVAPVGESFRYVRDTYGLERFQMLYQEDPTDDHPSEQGSYLSACVHYYRLFGNPCTGNPYYIDPLTVEDAQLLQDAADKTVESRNWDFDLDTCTNCVCECA